MPDYPLVEAAARLGTTTEAVRARLKRKSLEGYRDNKGRWRVCLPDGEGGDQTNGQTGSTDASNHLPGQDEEPSGHDQTLSSLREQIARLEAKLEGVELRLTDRDRELGEVKAERDQLLTMLGAAQAALAQRSQGWVTRVWDRLLGSRA